MVGRIASAASVPLASFAPLCSLPTLPLSLRAVPASSFRAFVPTTRIVITPAFPQIPHLVALQHVGELIHQLPLLHRGAVLVVVVKLLASC